MRVEETSEVVSKLQKQFADVTGQIKVEIQQAAECRFPLPVVVAVREGNNFRIVIGQDVLASLFNYQSDVHYMMRRISETRVRVHIVTELKTEDDRRMLADYVRCFQ